ncbi:hypothetical protein [Clostridium formicaceticum]|uniref:Uncharacterized protein n=1 Tax=Clostridium formicaceticum TaxID=1497 RepID=A0AAC9RJA4_9CLOT|nr:hypothetical protein [Clostridium formicaceticum]AOY76672.1 hypothetical protein BJL90_12830 [Clostridium formicaceticum]ARE87101.1 hypothetical protein CLFO_14870 [Clostridium formicaceticum]
MRTIKKALLIYIERISLMVYLIAKYTFVWGAAADILSMALSKLSNIQINEVLSLNIKRKTLNQNISFKMYFKTWKKDYYKNRDELQKELDKYSLNDLKTEKFHKYENAVFKCNTNSLFYRKHLKKLGNNLLIDENSTTEKTQVYVRLNFINSWALWRNSFSKEFWRFIFKKVILKDYYFKIN